MPKFRKKPVEIEAIQWTGENKSEILFFLGDSGVYNDLDVENSMREEFETICDKYAKRMKEENWDDLEGIIINLKDNADGERFLINRNINEKKKTSPSNMLLPPILDDVDEEDPLGMHPVL